MQLEAPSGQQRPIGLRGKPISNVTTSAVRSWTDENSGTKRSTSPLQERGQPEESKRCGDKASLQLTTGRMD